MERFIAILSPTTPQAMPPARLRDVAARFPGMSVLVERPGICLAAIANPNCQIADEGEVVILGPVFRAGSSEPARLQPGIASRPSVHILKQLPQEMWGNFLAITRDEAGSGFHIIRPAFGKLPCFYAWLGNQLLIASDSALLKQAGLSPGGLDWMAIAQRIAFRHIPLSGTCLSDVHELRGGTRLHVTAGATAVTPIWNPWDHAGRDHWIDDRKKAVESIRDAVLTATRAMVLGAERALLMLSGGIDSSILAASLGSHGCRYGGLNLTSTGAAGDERAYARMVTSHLGVPLIEAQWDVAAVDIFRSLAADMPNPLARSFMQGTCQRLAEAVETSGADLTLDGGGGDNLFFSLRSVAPVTDALVRGRSITQCWSTARSIADMAQVSMATVLQRATRRAFRRSPAYRWPIEVNYLTSDILNSEALKPRHPWLEPPRGAETGTAAHIALITAAQGWAEGSDLYSPVRHVSPLASQPVAEACLKIPSWWWFRDGINRAVARDAFQDRLPTAILERKAKGSPDSYIAEIFAANRHHIRPMLLDGALARAHLLDLCRLEHALDSQGIVQGNNYHRIMALADVEAWIAGQG